MRASKRKLRTKKTAVKSQPAVNAKPAEAKKEGLHMQQSEQRNSGNNNTDLDDFVRVQRHAKLWKWAEFLSDNGFQVHMKTDGSLRAVCMGCGKPYTARFRHAKKHIDKCPLPAKDNPSREERVVAVVDMPTEGSRIEMAWTTPNGRRVEAVATIAEVKQ